jgi:protein-S-isoprenylcysteine O-methyltransferase Ste14
MATLLRIVVLTSTGFLFLQLLWLSIRSRKEMVGKAPIHPALFYLAKICLCLSFAFLVLQAVRQPTALPPLSSSLLILGLLLAGIIILTVSFATLGRNLRMGLAGEKTDLVTRGIYRYSRNPIYTGIYLMLIASLLYAFSWVNAAAAACTILLHHRIILSEERDLGSKFPEYDSYRKRVRRYL